MKKSYSAPSLVDLHHNPVKYINPPKGYKRIVSATALNDLNVSMEAINFVPLQQIMVCTLDKSNDETRALKDYAACIASPPELEMERNLQRIGVSSHMSENNIRVLMDVVRRVRRKKTNLKN